MAVPHVDLDSHLLLAWNGVKRLLITVQRIMNVIRAVDEENWHAAAREQARGIVGLDPGIAALAKVIDRRLLDRLPFKQEAAAINGHGGSKTIVKRSNQA